RARHAGANARTTAFRCSARARASAASRCAWTGATGGTTSTGTTAHDKSLSPMRALTHSEKRTIRIGAIAVGAYLVLFSGMRTAKFFEHKRVEYQRLVHEAQGLKREIQIYDDKAIALKKIMENFNLDPARLSRTTAVAEASAAIQ